MTDAFDKLEKSKTRGGGSGDYAPWWEPDEGDKLIGVVVSIHTYTDPGGGDHDIRTIRSVGRGDYEQGVEWATRTQQSLEEGLEGSEIGDLVLAEYEGEEKTSNGFDMNIYNVSILKEEEWRQTDQEELIDETWDGDGTHDEDASSGNDDSSDETEGEFPDEVLSFAADVVAMNDGEMTFEELDQYLNDVRDYDVDTDEVIEEAELEKDGDDVVEA